jgi:hypothetical protein
VPDAASGVCVTATSIVGAIASKVTASAR